MIAQTELKVRLFAELGLHIVVDRMLMSKFYFVCVFSNDQDKPILQQEGVPTKKAAYKLALEAAEKHVGERLARENEIFNSLKSTKWAK